MDKRSLRQHLADHVIKGSFRMYYRHGDVHAQVYYIEEALYGTCWVATASDPELAKEYLIDYLIKNNISTLRLVVEQLHGRQLTEAECRYYLRKSILVKNFGKYVILGA